MKKIIRAFLLALIFIIAFASVSLAEVVPESDFEFDAATFTITKYVGKGGDVEIPASIGGVPVYVIGDEAFAAPDPTSPWAYTNGAITSVIIPDEVSSINDGAFRNNWSLKTIKMPNNLTTIGSGAFSNCRSLSSITIPDGVTYIGNWAFSSCFALKSVIIPDNAMIPNSEGMFFQCKELETVKLPSNMTAISDWTFSSCGRLKSVVIPDRVSSIGKGTFIGCGITEISIPNNVTFIGDSLFDSYSNSLSAINVGENNSAYASVDGVLFNKSKDMLIAYPPAKTATSYDIPIGVVFISKNAFTSCRALNTITIPEGVTSIEDLMFSGCFGLSSITIPQSVTSIGRYVFPYTLKTIYGYSGSYAEEYAIANNITFSPIE